MIRSLRYLLAIALLVYAIYLFRKKGLKLKIVKGIGCIIGFLIILIMPFEILFLKFDTPEQAFNYGGNNYNIIKIIEEEKTALTGKNLLSVIFNSNSFSFLKLNSPENSFISPSSALL